MFDLGPGLVTKRRVEQHAKLPTASRCAVAAVQPSHPRRESTLFGNYVF